MELEMELSSFRIRWALNPTVIVLMGRRDTERPIEKKQRRELRGYKHQGFRGSPQRLGRSKEAFSPRAFTGEYGPGDTLVLDL